MVATLAQVRSYIGKPSGDTEQDLDITALITRASVAIANYTGRKFVADDSSSTRTFDIFARDVIDRRIVIDDLSAAPTAVVTVDGDDTTVTTYTVGTHLLTYPLNREAWEPITALHLRTSGTGLSTSYRAKVTGVWGFPAVPDDVQQAAIMQVRTWWRRDIANTGTEDIYAPEGQSLERPFGLANEVKKMLSHYRRPGIA